MWQVPINRWMVGAMVALGLIFGNDIVAPIFKVIGILSSPYTPAM